MIHAEDGFNEDEYLKDIADLINEYCKKYEIENNEPIPQYKLAHPYVKTTKYPNCTRMEFQRAMHKYCPELSFTELIKASVYEKMKKAYYYFPNNIARFAEYANVSETLASLYIKFWARNGNKFSDEILAKFNQNYQQYLDGEISMSEFSKLVFNCQSGTQLLLLHMQQTFLISKHHYQKCKEKKDIRELEFAITGDYINKIFLEQKGKCIVTNQNICSFYASRNATSPYVYSIDRIDNSLGYIEGNIRLTTKDANMCRGSLTVKEFTELIVASFMTIVNNEEHLKHLYDEKILEKISFKDNLKNLFQNTKSSKDLKKDDALLTLEEKLEDKKIEYDYCCE